MGLDPGAVEGLGTVRVVGTGLLGTSVALGLSAGGADVLLSDPSPTSLALACDLGAGRPDPGGEHVDLVVVAAPPDVTAQVVAEELARHPRATVTDVASVKAGIAHQLADLRADLTRYVGSHPMAGRERSGPVAARGDLFLDRPWVLCPGAGSDRNRADAVRHLAVALGAWPLTMTPGEHDEAVALVSHLPQVAASLVAARLGRAPEPAVGLAGQGLRDVTRIAGSDPLLWAQILAANAGPVRRVLSEVRDDLDALLQALEALAAENACCESPAPGRPAAGPATGASSPASSPRTPASNRRRAAHGARAAVAGLVADGNTGRERIPGKHGGTPRRYAVLTVVVPDEPGSLGRLFADIGRAGVNVEELALEHAPGRAVGLVELSVLPETRHGLETALADTGWRLAGSTGEPG
ncbi:MAG: prephenate dehydrogenase [Actinomycetota bacterium]|nr:prephenate dehydrogenase [Actinomycetota bacterium]